MPVKPHHWNLDPALIAPRFRSLWRDAIVYPLRRGGGTVITAYPSKRNNLGTGTFPSWSGRHLNFTAASSEFIALDSALVVSPGTAMSLLSVFRSASETAQTMYSEGNSGTNNMIFDHQLRGDQAENYVRSFLRGNASSSNVADHSTNTSGVNYADGEWHAAATTYRDTTVAGGDFAGRIDGLDSFVTDSSSGLAPTARTVNQLSLGSLNRVSNAEFFDGDIALIVAWTRALTDAELWLASVDPFGMIRLDLGAAAFKLAQVFAVGLALEIDSAFGVTPIKTRTVGLAAETDTGLAVGARKTVAAGLALEADTGFAVAVAKAKALGLPVEVDTAFGVGSAKAQPVGLALETDIGLAAQPRRAYVLGLALEADNALAPSVLRTYQVSLAVEIDTAFPVATGQIIPVGLASEADVAFAVAVAKAKALGFALELDTGLAVQPRRLYPLGLALETDIGLGLSVLRTYLLGLATEAAVAFAVQASKSLGVGLALEFDTALAVLVVSGERQWIVLVPVELLTGDRVAELMSGFAADVQAFDGAVDL